MKIGITVKSNSNHNNIEKVEKNIITATLIDSPTARDFAQLFPLHLTMEDYANTEKISYLSRKLSTEGAPKGVSPTVGDITYYAPWGNLAIFYRNFGYAAGLIVLGKIEEGLDILTKSATVDIEIDRL